MAGIKPAEVSEVLKKQLEGIKSTEELQEIGTVLQIGDGIARIYGLDNVESNELIEFENGIKGMVLNLEEDNVGAVLLGSSEEIREGDSVKRTGRIASLDVGEGMLGRVINTLGEPIDGRGPIKGDTIPLPLERKAPGVMPRKSAILSTSSGSRNMPPSPRQQVPHILHSKAFIMTVIGSRCPAWLPGTSPRAAGPSGPPALSGRPGGSP